MRQLTVGKMRGMTQLADERGIITVTALDHRGSLRDSLQKALPNEKVGYDRIVSEKLRMLRALAPHSSAVLLDPVYGAASAVTAGAVPGNVGLLVALEESGYEGGDEDRVTPLTQGWSVAKIKSMGACAVKVLLYYHPASAAAAQQEALVRRVAEDCRRYDIPFLLEPMSYSITPGEKKGSAEFARQKPDLVLESARRLAGLGIDLLKAEFPDDPHHEKDETTMRRHCRELTAISPVPWVILSAAESFGTFQRLVELACEEGASGFMVGRAIWQETMTLSDEAARDEFLQRFAVSRLLILKAIAKHRGRPWNDVSEAAPVAEGWHATYQQMPELVPA